MTHPGDPPVTASEHTAAQAGDRRFATTLARGLAVLRAFRTSDDGLTAAEIARRTGLPKPTVSRLVYTLVQLGYLSQPGQGERLRPGPSLLAVGHVAQASLSFLSLADAPMQALADRSGTLVFLGVRDRDKMLLAQTWRPQGTASIWLEPGHRVPLAGAATGQAMLAAMDDAMLARVVADQPHGGLTLAGAQALRAQARAQCLSRGFVIPPAAQRNYDRINALAVPFRSSQIAEPVAFSCGATPDILPDARMLEQVGPDLLATVQGLERMTGQVRTLSRLDMD